MTDPVSRLTGGRLLARNTAWSLLGMGVPLAVAAIAIPFLIKGLGTERFGLLSIIWVIVGYFSAFDLGMGRALTKLVSERLGQGNEGEIPDLVITALVIIGALGVVAAGVIAAVVPWLVNDILKTSASLRAEGERAFWILSSSLPFIIVSGGLVGLLESHQQFRAISLVRSVTGSLSFLGPLIALHWTPLLTATATALVISRVLATGAYAGWCLVAFPGTFRRGRFRTSLLLPLIDFGGWFTVSNVISPIMVYMDRFFIGAIAGLTAVTYYTTPYEAVTRLKVLPISLVNVLFPAFAAVLVTDERRAVALFSRAYRVILLAVFPLIALVVLFAPEGLAAWIGPAFAQHSASILRWIAAGVFINSVARLPHALVQSAGRPDLIAKVHFVELPVYLVTLWLLLHIFGVVGAAAAWTLRIVIDTFAFFWLGVRLVPGVKESSIEAVCLLVSACLFFTLLSVLTNVAVKIALISVLLPIVAGAAWQEFKAEMPLGCRKDETKKT